MSTPHHPSRAILTHVTAFTAALLLTACGTKDAATTDSARADSIAAAAAAAAPAPAPSAPALNDAQIAHVAVTANAVDSAAGELASKQGASKEIKDFGRTMTGDHGSVNKDAVALVTKLGVTPEDNDLSRQLKSGGDQNLATLQGLTGAAFDKAYIEHEVTYHQAVLDALDKTLIPGAQNAELKALLEKVRPNIVAHLERARALQGKIATP
jgi:putative membrane protein